MYEERILARRIAKPGQNAKLGIQIPNNKKAVKQTEPDKKYEVQAHSLNLRIILRNNKFNKKEKKNKRSLLLQQDPDNNTEN